MIVARQGDYINRSKETTNLPLREPECFRYDPSTNRSFFTVLSRETIALATRVKVIIAPQLFAEASQALYDLDHNFQQENIKAQLQARPERHLS